MRRKYKKQKKVCVNADLLIIGQLLIVLRSPHNPIIDDYRV